MTRKELEVLNEIIIHLTITGKYELATELDLIYKKFDDEKKRRSANQSKWNKENKEYMRARNNYYYAIMHNFSDDVIDERLQKWNEIRKSLGMKEELR